MIKLILQQSQTKTKAMLILRQICEPIKMTGRIITLPQQMPGYLGERVGAYIISDSQKLKMPPAINLDEYRVENQNFTIIIPALNLEAPIVSDIPNFKTANPNETEGEFGDRIQAALEKGTLHYPDSSLPSDTYRGFNRNTVILGHSASNDFGPESYKDIFSDLQELELDNLIIIHYQGIEYTYKVYDKQITDPTAVGNSKTWRN